VDVDIDILWCWTSCLQLQSFFTILIAIWLTCCFAQLTWQHVDMHIYICVIVALWQEYSTLTHVYHIIWFQLWLWSQISSGIWQDPVLTGFKKSNLLAYFKVLLIEYGCTKMLACRHNIRFVFVASHTSTVWSIDFDASGSRLVSCSDDRTLKIWKRYFPGNARGICNFCSYYTGWSGHGLTTFSATKFFLLFSAF